MIPAPLKSHIEQHTLTERDEIATLKHADAHTQTPTNQ